MSESDIGVSLMSKAFGPNKGRLVIPACVSPAEQEGVYTYLEEQLPFLKTRVATELSATKTDLAPYRL